MVWPKGRALILSTWGSRGAGCQGGSAEEPVSRQGGERRGVQPLLGAAFLRMPDSFKGSVYSGGQLLPASSQFFGHFPKSDHAFFY